MKYTLLFVVIGLITSYGNAYAKSDVERINTVLDSLHQAASIADFSGYFNFYSNTAVFIGTDASEVWHIDEFKAYAKPHFDKGTGWTYRPRDRHVYLSSNKDVAWFDELLDNDKLGETRGTGVLTKQNDTWKVSQYHLTIPIPNSIASNVASQIKAVKE